MCFGVCVILGLGVAWLGDGRASTSAVLTLGTMEAVPSEGIVITFRPEGVR